MSFAAEELVCETILVVCELQFFAFVCIHIFSVFFVFFLVGPSSTMFHKNFSKKKLFLTLVHRNETCGAS